MRQFEHFHHLMQLKANLSHVTMLMPEEDNHEYVQDHQDGICTQFRHCEDNPFYPAITQADGNEGWYRAEFSVPMISS